MVPELLGREPPEHAREPLRRELHNALALDFEGGAAPELGFSGREQLAYTRAARVADREADPDPRDAGEQCDEQSQSGASHAPVPNAASASSSSSGRRT